MVVNDQSNAQKSRVITYIDGFNLHFGLHAKGWNKYQWLDLCKLSRALMEHGQSLQLTKYFTSRVRGNIGKQQRQTAYLDALTTLDRFSIFWGNYQPDQKQCQKCGHYAYHPIEKKTDVNIATQLLCDAFHDLFDTALIVSGDSDLVPPIEAVKDLHPAKRVVVAFPPKRFSSELALQAHGYFNIFEAKLRQSRLPWKVTLPSGMQVECPSQWR
ncbi:MAG: NYN domain-containing protein [Candidatus Sulfotelmatobacter sp.]